jgi:hypothetical protein
MRDVIYVCSVTNHTQKRHQQARKPSLLIHYILLVWVEEIIVSLSHLLAQLTANSSTSLAPLGSLVRYEILENKWTPLLLMVKSCQLKYEVLNL